MEAQALVWLSAAIALVLCVLTVLPLIRTGHWIARCCDFPRLQILALCLVPLSFVVLSAMLATWDTYHTSILCALAFIAAWQAWRILHYTRIWPSDVPTKVPSSHSLDVMIVNLDYENDKKAEVLSKLHESKADVLLLIEIDDKWNNGLDVLRKTYPFEHGVVRDDGLGILILSQHKFAEAEVCHLVDDQRASIRCIINPGSQPVELYALHPRPPGLKEQDGDGRYNSRERDAELVLVAKHVRDADPMHRMVLGDLNDVAWSHTTRLFRRLSGMKDPRIGRAYLSTFHAEYPLMRYPLDHIFVSDELGVSELKRIKVPGSDHFGVFATILIPNGNSPDSNDENATESDLQEAEDIVDAAFVKDPTD